MMNVDMHYIFDDHVTWAGFHICNFQMNLTPPVMERTYSMESLDLVSNPESTMTSASSIRELHQDLDIVQKSHDRITKLEVQLDVSKAV